MTSLLAARPQVTQLEQQLTPLFLLFYVVQGVSFIVCWFIEPTLVSSKTINCALHFYGNIWHIQILIFHLNWWLLLWLLCLLPRSRWSLIIFNSSQILSRLARYWCLNARTILNHLFCERGLTLFAPHYCYVGFNACEGWFQVFQSLMKIFAALVWNRWGIILLLLQWRQILLVWEILVGATARERVARSS